MDDNEIMHVSCPKPTEDTLDNLKQLRKWADICMSYGEGCKGYTRKDVDTYGTKMFMMINDWIREIEGEE